MSLEAAATPAAPAAAPAAPAEAATPTATTEATPAAESAKTGKQRARDLAGKFLQGGWDMPGPEVASPAAAAAEPTAEPTPEKPVEAKPEPDKAKTKLAPDPALDKSWREVHRRKKQQRDERAALATQQAELAAEKARFAAWESEKQADERLKAEDPPAWLEKHRFDFREVAQQAVAKQQLTPEQKAAKEEFDAIRAELAAEKAAREKSEKERDDVLTEYKAERAEKAQRAALAQLHEETKTEWAQAQPEFPSLAAFYTPEEIAEAATELRLDHYRKTKREAPLDEVFAFMEKNAAEHQKRFSRESPTPERTERETVVAQAAKTRAKVGPTVTNQVAATRASPQTPLTEAEKRKRAVEKAAVLLGPRH